MASRMAITRTRCHYHCLLLLLFSRGLSTTKSLLVSQQQQQKNVMPPIFNTNLTKLMKRTYAQTSSQRFNNKSSKKVILSGSMNAKPLVVVISGPTGVGKSAVAAEFCAKFPSLYNKKFAPDAPPSSMLLFQSYKGGGHIISADSVQAYQGVQIGANKPTLDELEATPHYLVDVVDPHGSYTAADWRRDTVAIVGHLSRRRCCRNKEEVEDELLLSDDDNYNNNIDIIESMSLRQANIQRAKDASSSSGPILPVVVGGTMMYIDWLIHGKPDAPQPSKEALEKASSLVLQWQNTYLTDNDENSVDLTTNTGRVSAESWQKVIELASQQLDKALHSRIHKLGQNDWYRLRRTLEVAFSSSSVGGKTYKGERVGSLSDLGYDVRCFFLCPNDRMLHTSVVDSRCEDMLLKGLLKETAELVSNGKLPDEGQPAKAIGYRQTLEYLRRDNFSLRNDSESFIQYIEDFAAATRQYAKKQMQWFRKDSSFMFVPVDLECDSSTRVEDTTNMLIDLCLQDTDSFHSILTNKCDEDGNISLSEKTKHENELQGKKMKFYMPKRYKLVPGSSVFLSALEEADNCTEKVKSIL